MQDLQKRIVTLGRTRDTNGLILVMTEILNADDASAQISTAAKTALTIATTFLDCFRDQNSLKDLYDVSRKLFESHPSLQELENVQFSFVKLQLALGMVDAAVESAEHFGEPRLRMFSAILDKCADTHDRETALKVLRILRNSNLNVTEKEVALVLKCGLLNNELDEFLKDLSLDFQDPLSESTLDFNQMESVHVVSSITIDPHSDSICPVTGIKLEKIGLTEAELDELISMTRSLATEAGFTNKDNFDDILNSQLIKLPEVVLDGANIAHVNQNFAEGFFRFDQIQDVFENFKSKDCLIVLHAKWLSPNKDLRLFPIDPSSLSSEPKRLKKRKKPALPPLGVHAPVPQDTIEEPHTETKPEIVRPVPMQLIEEWRKTHVLFQVPHNLNDDWFWMHICCLSIRGGKSDLLLVSNDLMRDHYWRMQHPKAFSRFVKNHVCRYSIQFGEDGINQYKYMYPPNHSICMHRHETMEDGTRTVLWHIPYRSTDSSEIKWLLVRF